MIFTRQDYNTRIVDLAGIIPADEPAFLLLARDQAAPHTVRCWADRAALLGASPEIVELARRAAVDMERWQRAQREARGIQDGSVTWGKVPDLPNPPEVESLWLERHPEIIEALEDAKQEAITAASVDCAERSYMAGAAVRHLPPVCTSAPPEPLPRVAGRWVPVSEKMPGENWRVEVVMRAAPSGAVFPALFHDGLFFLETPWGEGLPLEKGMVAFWRGSRLVERADRGDQSRTEKGLPPPAATLDEFVELVQRAEGGPLSIVGPLVSVHELEALIDRLGHFEFHPAPAMNLDELSRLLREFPPEQRVSVGFAFPHSYRGDYAQLAFQRAEDVTVAQMLAAAEGALGKRFLGYKGGAHEMHRGSSCWLANYGETGVPISYELMQTMLGRQA